MHTAIMAGTGSGKTVVLRRLVEEAALGGVPAIVLDLANDLSRLGQPWPKRPQNGWLEDDSKKESDYFSKVKVKVWTPGLFSGHPLYLSSLPDLPSVSDDIDQLKILIEVTRGNLSSLLGLSNQKDSSKIKEAILARILEWMAFNGGGDLLRLSSLLKEPPPESAVEAISKKALKYAEDLCGLLNSELIKNPLLNPPQKPHGIEDLLYDGDRTKTVVSVLNLGGLGTLSEQQIFLGQLVSCLFTYIKKKPSEKLGGLLVIDEAKEFIPSMVNTPCKQGIIRFVAQARKYGFGLVLATQEPKSVDHKIMGNCTTQLYGKQNSPAAVNVVEEMLGIKGVARL